MTTKQITQWHLLKDTHVGAFNTTSELIDHTIKLHSEANSNQDYGKRAIAGTLFESYAIEYFEQIKNSNIMCVLDKNKIAFTVSSKGKAKVGDDGIIEVESGDVAPSAP